MIYTEGVNFEQMADSVEPGFGLALYLLALLTSLRKHHRSLQ